MKANRMYLFCMIVFPVFVTFFFTSLMDEGQPQDMPVGVVDLDNSSTTRKLTRLLDSFQSTKVVAHYPSVDEARHAVQKGDIYGFVYFPKNTTCIHSAFISGQMSEKRQPMVLSFMKP